MRKAALLLAAIAAGCTTTTGVVPIGKDTFLVSGTGKSPGGYSGTQVKVDAIKQATAYCKGQNLEMQIVRTEQRDMSFGELATAEVHFMCIEPTDSEFRRPKFKPDPTTVVEVTNTTKTPETPPDRLSELKKLGELRAAGVITEAEFNAMKARILGAK